jgi:amino acid adenylation domain-containing protein
METGIEQVIAMLGILKAGYAYVPINAHLPNARIKKLLAKINSKIVVTQEKFKSKIIDISHPEQFDNKNILIVDERLGSYSDAPIFLNKSGKDLAYGIFTSGTTGVPKLVMIAHESAVNTIIDINNTYHVSSQDTVFAISSFDFDLSVYDYFGLLAVGGTVVLPSYEHRKDPAHWLELFQKNRVTIWNSVPMLMEMLLEYVNAESSSSRFIRSLRLCLLSGDYIPMSLPDRLRSYFTPSDAIEIISLGGATECSIWSIAYPIREIDQSWKTIPYGKSLKNQHVYVLNSSYQLCPQGVIGEIFISGMGVAQGYLNDEEKNNYHFFTHPLTKHRMYRTGDLGRYFPNGDIEFLGRKDGQIKLSGHRIELSEVQHYLEKHPSVDRAILYFDNTNQKAGKIFAFVKLKNELIEPNEYGDQYYLKHYLITQLPEYMVPTLILPVIEFPLTTNGKIDNTSLLKIADKHLGTIDKTQKAETEQAKQICAIWQEELKVPEIGLNQNLFELGATSITVTKIFFRLKDIVKPEMALIDLFKYPTVGGFINFINSRDNVMNSLTNEHNLVKKQQAIKERRKTLKSRKLHV